MKAIRLNLDIMQDTNEYIELMQGYDYKLECEMLYDGEGFDLTGYIPRVEMLMSNGNFIIQATHISVKDNIVTVDLDSDFTNVSGDARIQIVLEKEGKITGSWTIYSRIKQGALYKSKDTKSKADITEELIKTVNEAVAVKEETENLIATGGAATKGDIASVNERLEHIESEKVDKELFDSRRVFKPKIYGNLNWSVSKKVNEIYPFTDETLNSWIGCIDGIIIDFQIKPNESIINDDTTYFLNPTTDWLNYVIKKCNDLNIKIKGVKFHADEIRDNVNNLIFTNWFNKYKELIRSVTNVLKCDYLLYFNESSSLLNREVTEVNIINEFTNELKSLGYEVGFAGTGVKNLDKGYVFDIISFHQYPAISGKLNHTTYNDSLIAWQENRNTYLLNKAIRDYPNKKVMLGEAGCPDSWECLAVPEKWDWNSNDLTPNSQGLPSSIFLYGMLETYKNTNLDCACFWYCDPMLKETQILLKKYL